MSYNCGWGKQGHAPLLNTFASTIPLFVSVSVIWIIDYQEVEVDAVSEVMCSDDQAKNKCVMCNEIVSATKIQWRLRWLMIIT